jgi:hypothetical protein
MHPPKIVLHGVEARNRVPVAAPRRRRAIPTRLMCLGLLLAPGLGPGSASAQAPAPANPFGDPFLQVTGAIAACPVPQPTRYTEEQVRAEAHQRAERGTSCYRAGRCRLPNAYLYDREIIPRVKLAVEADGRFADSSLWVEGQARWVWLRGCVRSPDQVQALEALVRHIDDVDAVVNQLQVLPR